MLAGTTSIAVEGYNRIGSSACDLIEDALALLDRPLSKTETILDFGSGYGRVVRALVRRIPPKNIDVFDVDRNAVKFCAREFHVNPLYFQKKDRWDFLTVRFRNYDVIWLGSVFTHLSRAYALETIQTLAKIIKPGGVIVFTTHSDQTFPRLSEGYYGERWQSCATSIIQEYHSHGFCFVPYTKPELEILPFNFIKSDDFGMTWMSEEFVQELFKEGSNDSLKQIKYIPLGWDNHQDVYYFHKFRLLS
jgi:SAM-dependent methyltransferase